MIEKDSSDNLSQIHECCKSVFVDKHNFAFAIALNIATGYPIVGVVRTEAIVHAGVCCPKGNLYDARGLVSKDAFIAAAVGSGTPTLRTITDRELANSEGVKIRSEEIRQSLMLIARLYPEIVRDWRIVSDYYESPE